MRRPDPLLVVLDEPTASLDAPSSTPCRKICAAAVRTARRTGAVTVLVSHRFSTVRVADLIIFVAGGDRSKWAATTTWCASVAVRELFELQSAGYR